MTDSIMGSQGGMWYSPYPTKVVFTDADFAATGEYDFGRQVVGVSCAEVSECEAVNAREYDAGAFVKNGRNIY